MHLWISGHDHQIRRKKTRIICYVCEQDDIDGIFHLGRCYDLGIGTEINKEKAIELHTIAANKGNSLAQNNLGILYEIGGWCTI